MSICIHTCVHTCHLCSIALVYEQQGNFPEALELYHKSLATKEKVLGCEHLETANTRENIVNVHLQQGKHAEALEVYKDVLALKEKVLGPEHLETAKTHNKCVLLQHPEFNMKCFVQHWHGV